MQAASLNSLIGLRAQWQSQVNFYRLRLLEIEQEIDNPNRASSLSWLEAEKRTLQHPLDSALAAIDELTRIIKEVQNA